MLQMLVNIRHTLNKISVQGEDNLNMLLGCIKAMDHLIKQNEEAAQNDETNKND